MLKRPIVLTTLAFAVIGPLIASLLIIAWALSSALIGAQAGNFTQEFAIPAFPVLAWSYALGWLPASAMGLAWSVLCLRFNQSRSLTFAVRSATGACLGIAFGATAGLLWDWWASTSFERTRLIYFSIPCSIIAGSLLCIAFPRAIWLQRRAV